MASVADSGNFATDNLGKESVSDALVRPEVSLGERVFNKSDQYNFAKVILTRLLTSGIGYAFTNREQDRVINEELKERGSKNYDPSMPEATPFGRWVHKSLYKPIYWANRKVADATASIAGSFGKTDEEKKANYDKAHSLLYEPKNRNGTIGYDEGVTIDEKVGRTLSGFFWGALLNNAQVSAIKAVELGDSAPWVNKDGSIDAGTATKWAAQEVFRGVLKGAGEDVFASNSLYTGIGSWWIDKGKDAYKKLTGVDIDVDKKAKPFFLHAWEWVAKFWAYNVFTDWWRGIYDNCLGGIERMIGGKKNNPIEQEPDERSLIQKVVEVPYKIIRSIIRVPLKLLLPMPIATFFGFVIPGYYSSVQWGTKYGGENGPEAFFKGAYDANGINALDTMGKSLGKGINDIGSKIDAAIKFDPKTGFDGIGVEGSRAYGRYAPYFGMKKYFLDKWAGPEVDKAMNKAIDGFFGGVLNSLIFNFKGAKKSFAKMKEGSREYLDIITFKHVPGVTDTPLPAAEQSGAQTPKNLEGVALEEKKKTIKSQEANVLPAELILESSRKGSQIQPVMT